ncbi:MAG TPA: CoB--CoM heterodisulfide reductase iron-sulfur subunit A family protein [Thermoleophilia bacterium]|nr:CoB--CoM heterodisulfide reductase iron-sulfur subunit A family protein [Thermoleophilia bacterium]
MRIGVFVCRCGSNIAGTVDTAALAERVLHERNVVHSDDITYSCSQPGQDAIKNAIHEKGLTRVVVASCSPRMHEPTFRRAVAEGGLNPYLMEMVNIREQCSWIHDDKEVATEKAFDLVLKGIERVRRQRELQSSTAPITKRALVIGGGVAGIQAALDIADAGIEVVLVDRDVTIGGKMARLDKTFPTLDCSACILTPRMVEAAQHPKITLMTYSEVTEVRGYVGNFEVDIKHKAAYVDFDKCVGCGICEEKCPRKAPDLFNGGDYKSKAIYIPFPQAVPKVAVLRPEYCTYFEKGKCKVCQKFCDADAIDFEQQDRIVTEKFGAIVVAIGYDLFDYTKYYPEYGMGRFKNVISGFEYERLMCASGPTQGHIVKHSDGGEPKTVVFVQCVGSRDEKVGRPYCSGVCCMYTAKQAIMTKEHDPDVHTYIFYIDIRAGGKGYEDFVTRAQVEYGVTYIRGRVAKIYELDGKTMVRGEDTLLGEQVEIAADLVVLATGIEPSAGAKQLASTLHCSSDGYGFFNESHPKLRPVETQTAGVFLAGCAIAPRDIPSSVADGSAAASKATQLLLKDFMVTNPQTSHVDRSRCIGCYKCVEVCPYGAVEKVEDVDGQPVASVVSAVCQGCGLCVAACTTGAMTLEGFTSEQLIAEVESLCRL